MKGERERENNEEQKRQKRNKGVAQVRCCAFKLGFVQLMHRPSLIFKSNLELALSTILKERELYDTKHAVVEYKCLKIWDLLSFLICSSILA